jgi:integrase
MKKRFWLFKRAGVFYLQDVETRKKESLHTTDRREAERLREARHEAAEHPHLGLTLAKAYLTAYDPEMPKRTWATVMKEFCDRGQPQTQARRQSEIAGKPFDIIRHKKLIETTADDFLNVLKAGGVFTHAFLKCVHNLAVGLGWLPWPILPQKLWPVVITRKKRGITLTEHQSIIASEKNEERRRYYELVWEIGASQTDTVLLSAENIDWERKILAYQRKKTGQWAYLSIGARLEALLRRLPKEGPFFPKIRTSTDSARSAEFYRRCRLAGVKGVSLHSYRYAWAERAKACGYPERWAQNALGHNSRAVHEAYAKEARAICPPLEDYEQRPAKEIVLNTKLGSTTAPTFSGSTITP